MKSYQVKNCKLSGSSYNEVYKKAWQVYLLEKKKSKRRTYVRSVYFKKSKIFLDVFWNHLKQKNWVDRFRRLKYYFCAIELIKNSRIDPETFQDVNNSKEILHRFSGVTKNGEEFFVQIKENKRTDQKYFVSVFPKK